jgi:8-oxo-dGTP pyrophosphatase MutT (NUDIX family)
MPNKRKVSLLIPYHIRQGKIFVFLQKRAKDAKRLPDYFGLFGGGIENNESSEEALKREILEELDFVPEEYKFFRFYDFEQGAKYVYILKVSDNFEKNIKILEGEYGKFFSEEDVLRESKLIDEDKVVLKDLYELLYKQGSKQ